MLVVVALETRQWCSTVCVIRIVVVVFDGHVDDSIRTFMTSYRNVVLHLISKTFTHIIHHQYFQKQERKDMYKRKIRQEIVMSIGLK